MSKNNHIKVCAHRGASSTHPENTCMAFSHAVILGTPMIEFDVRRSADNQFVIMHDATVDRTTDGSGQVSKCTLDYLRTLDAGDGEKIPTLDEALDFGDKVILNIQIKIETDSDINPTAQILAQKIAERNLYNSAFISAGLPVLQKVHKLDSRIKLCALFSTRKENSYVEDVLDKMPACTILQPNHSIVTKELVEKAHKNGMKVNPFFANDKETAQHFAKCGVDGILTDKPAKMLGWLNAINKH